MIDMFQKKQFEEFGSYCQQFMYIILRSPDHNVLLHEYIHHLQNVTTYYSISTFLCMKYLYFDYIARAKKWDDSLLMKNSYGRNLLFLYETLGGRIDRSFKNVEICNIYYNEKYNHITSLELSLLIDNDPAIVRYKLGTIAIKEGMANIIEQKYYPNENSNNVLTYHICKLLICHICPNLQNNTTAIVAILELSLMSSSPVEVMLHLLSNLKDKKSEDVTPKIIYAITCDFVHISINQDGKVSKTTLMDIYNDIHKMIDDVLDLFYTLFIDADGNLFDSFKKWQKNTLKDSYAVRKENPLLLTSMMETNVYTNHDSLIGSYIIKMPPLIYSNYKFMHFTDDVVKGNLILFLAEEEVFRKLYTNEDKSCNLKEICKRFIKYGGKGTTKNPSIDYGNAPYESVRALKSVYDEQLCKKPTERPLNEYLCPFTTIWRKIIT